jgi:hypothetical protein
MSSAKVIFHKLIQDSQDYGSDNEHMVSRVFFSLEIGEESYPDLSADIKQTVGSSYETGPLEISTPRNYKGPFNFDAFQAEVEKYYRNQVGSSGSGIRISGGSNIRMRNNVFVKEYVVEFEIGTENAGW